MMRFFCFFLNWFRQLVHSRSGNFAVGFALVIPLLLGLAGGVIDLVQYKRMQLKMQALADQAALAATREGGLKGWDLNVAKAVAKLFVENEVGTSGGSEPLAQFAADAQLDKTGKKVTVSVSMDHHPFFYVGYFTGSPQIVVKATATVTSDMNLCVIGLDPVSPKTVSLSGTSKVTAPNCAVVSNSSSPTGFSSVDDAFLGSEQNCSAGGFAGALRNYGVMPTKDCPAVPDPLAGRKRPSTATCNFTNKVVKGFVTILTPGVYCGGITISDKANVLFKPGVYVIKDGELKSSLGGIAAGVGVGFYFTGEGSRYNFDTTTTISFTAPSTGEMAGLLFYQDPDMKVTLDYEIASINARKLLGTIYLPNGNFKVYAKNRIGEESAYTVIVAKTIDIGAQADLVINSDYASTTVPVPEGLGPVKGLHVSN